MAKSKIPEAAAKNKDGGPESDKSSGGSKNSLNRRRLKTNTEQTAAVQWRRQQLLTSDALAPTLVGASVAGGAQLLTARGLHKPGRARSFLLDRP